MAAYDFGTVSLNLGTSDRANPVQRLVPRRLLSSYLLYYHEDRTHLGLAKDTPAGRATEIRSAGEGKIQSFPRLGGLHHRYAVAARLKSNSSEEQALLLEPGQSMVNIILRASFAGRRISLPSKTEVLTSSVKKSF